MAGRYIVGEVELMRVMVFLSQSGIFLMLKYLKVGSGICELWINEEFMAEDIIGYCR